MNPALIALAALALIALIISVSLSAAPENKDDQSSNDAVDSKIKEREKEEAEDKKAEDDKAKREKEESDLKEKKRKKKEEEYKKWVSDGPDFEAEYQVGDIVQHIGQTCMVVKREKRWQGMHERYAFVTGWDNYLGGGLRRIEHREKRSAALWIQFPDQVHHHKISEEDVKLKITK